jgi:2-keto-4-pentenoate hydratase/2-oxohepta-3-ene-1,7-dioic acid hydratase in catechol pathway
MKLLSYKKEGVARTGALVSKSSIVDLVAGARLHYQSLGVNENRAEAMATSLLGRNMVEFLEAGEPALALARQVVAAAEAGGGGIVSEAILPLSSIRLLAPVPKPGKVLGIGGNYPEIREFWPTKPKTPPIFQKARSCVIGPEDAVVLPAISNYVQPEMELVAIIGQTARNVAQKDVWDIIAGYTIGNDLSAIDILMSNWVRRARPDIVEFGLPGEAYYNFALAFESKSFDTFGVTGPYLVTRDEVDAQNLELKFSHNGKVIQTGNTRDMIVKIPEMIEFITRICTLEPGDIVFTGARGMLPKLKPGDRLGHSIQGLGEFESICVAELAAK